jgi:hypothetical protein
LTLDLRPVQRQSWMVLLGRDLLLVVQVCLCCRGQLWLHNQSSYVTGQALCWVSRMSVMEMVSVSLNASLIGSSDDVSPCWHFFLAPFHHSWRVMEQSPNLQFFFNLLRVIFWVAPRHVVINSRRFGTLCLLHLHRRVNMKCVKVESYVVEAGTDWPSPSWGGLQVAVWRWILMTGVVVRVRVLSAGGGFTRTYPQNVTFGQYSLYVYSSFLIWPAASQPLSPLSYIYMELLVKLEMFALYIYEPTFGNTESCLFQFAAQCFNNE